MAIKQTIGKDSYISNISEHYNEDQERITLATPRQLMWWKFRKHKLALVSVFFLLFLYIIALFCEFIAPYDPYRYDVKLVFSPPQGLHFFDEDGFHLLPFAYGLIGTRDQVTLRKIYKIDPNIKLPLRLIVRGDPYKLWGIIETDLHLFGFADNTKTVYLFGGDKLGRDVFSRLLIATRVSATIGLLGVILSFFLGVVIGGLSGYYGGIFDIIVQRIIEFVRSIPAIPLWLGLSAAIPEKWSVTMVFFAITIILSLISWTNLARVVRGRFLSLREEDFILAAKFAGTSEWGIVIHHMVPSFISYIIASLTLAVPVMILSETSLSFLGLGIRPPALSWGVLLTEAQNLQSIAFSPWLLTPALLVVITVLAFNFIGDGLRDAADPFSK